MTKKKPVKNRLLGQTYAEPEKEIEINTFQPIWLYSADCPKGLVIKKQAEYDLLIEKGWVDHPGKCTLLPGFEDLFEGNESSSEVPEDDVSDDETPEPEVEVETEDAPDSDK